MAQDSKQLKGRTGEPRSLAETKKSFDPARSHLSLLLVSELSLQIPVPTHLLPSRGLPTPLLGTLFQPALIFPMPGTCGIHVELEFSPGLKFRGGHFTV